MTLARLPLTATPVESLLGRVGTLQGPRGRAPGRSQARPPSRSVWKTSSESSRSERPAARRRGALEFHPFAQPRAVVTNHGLK